MKTVKLMLLGGVLVVAAGSLGVLAGKQRDGESEAACIARVIAFAAALVALFILAICSVRS